MNEKTVLPAMTCKETCRLIVTDYHRLRKHYRLEDNVKSFINIYLTHSMWVVFLFRWSHYFYAKGWRFASRMLYLVNFFFTGAELMPQSIVGEGLLLIHPSSAGFDGVIGKDITILGQACIGGNPMDSTDVGAGPGRPVIEDNVQFGLRCMVLGPVRIGKNAIIGPGAVVMKSVPEDGVVMALPPKIFTNKDKDSWVPRNQN